MRRMGSAERDEMNATGRRTVSAMHRTRDISVFVAKLSSKKRCKCEAIGLYGKMDVCFDCLEKVRNNELDTAVKKRENGVV